MNEHDRAELIKWLGVSHPEKSFSGEGFKTRNIENIIEQFGRGHPPRPLFNMVITVLTALRDFRIATSYHGFFAELRNQNASDEELHAIFNAFFAAIKTAEQQQMTLDENDKTIMEQTLHYCKDSVIERIKQLDTNDRLLPIWDQSPLRTWIAA